MGDGRFTAHGARRLGDLGTLRRVRCGARAACRGGREPPRPSGQLLLSLPFGCVVRAGRSGGHPAAVGTHRARAACRHQPRGTPGARRDGVVGRRGGGTRARGRRSARRARSRGVAHLGRAAARRRATADALLGQLRPTASGVVRRVASARPAATDLARLGAAATHGDLRRSLGRRGALADCAGRRELAGGLAPAHVPGAAVHRAQPRSLRVVPVPRHRIGVASARCAFARRARWPPVVDREGVVEGTTSSSPAAAGRRCSATPKSVAFVGWPTNMPQTLSTGATVSSQLAAVEQRRPTTPFGVYTTAPIAIDPSSP